MSTTEDDAKVARLREILGTTAPAMRAFVEPLPERVAIACPECRGAELPGGFRCGNVGSVLTDRARLRVWP